MPKQARYRASLSRRPARAFPRPRILVVCEGRVTEPSFIREFSKCERNRLVDVVVNDEGGVPKTLVERAVALKKAASRDARRQKDQFLAYDEVWCVLDVDVHPNLPQAHQQARDNHIHLAISNPCFELWLLLHFQNQRAHLERAEAQAACRRHMPGYAKLVPFNVLYPNYEHAVACAITLEKWQKESGRARGNPSTSMHHLTEQVRNLGRNLPIPPLIPSRSC